MEAVAKATTTSYDFTDRSEISDKNTPVVSILLLHSYKNYNI